MAFQCASFRAVQTFTRQAPLRARPARVRGFAVRAASNSPDGTSKEPLVKDQQNTKDRGQGDRAPDPLSKGVAAATNLVRDVVKGVSSDSDKGDPKNLGEMPPFPVQQQNYPGEEHKMDPRPDFGYDTYVGNNKLKDKVALITGGDSGIGRAVALAFAREGAHVAISYLDEHQDAEETKGYVEEAGREALLLPGDLTTEETCKSVVDQTIAKFGHIDILVNNAAFQGEDVDDIKELSRDRVERAFKTNIIAMFDITRFAKPHMPKGSSIINTTSVVAYQPIPGILDYAATKGAIVTFTKGLANQALLRDGIRVNAVAPGPVWTPIIPVSFNKALQSGLGVAQTPMNRAAQPRELAPAYVFLASDEASYINAEVVNVTGGMTIQ